MIKKYFTEAEEDIEMDVQVGPEKEINTEIGDPAKNIGIDDGADSIIVACNNKEDGVNEFFVDFNDVAKHAIANEQTFVESLNDVIIANEGSGLSSDNLTVILTEGENEKYEAELEQCGVACATVSEAAEEDNVIEIPVVENAAASILAVKADPSTVPVAFVESEGAFYVDANDLAMVANLNEATMLDSLAAVMEANNESGMCFENTIVVLDEGTLNYGRNLDAHGVICVVNESVEDIEMDVQVGPKKEEESVSEDPQTANPVDAVKREYENVIVSKSDDQFFTDVEDVQKCAELKCESVIDTLNGILEVNEEAGVTVDNFHVVVSENADADLVQELIDAGVSVVM